MDINWFPILQIGLHLHIISCTVLYTIALTSQRFYKEAKDEKGFVFLIFILSLCPVISQIFLYWQIKATRKEFKDAKLEKELGKKIKANRTLPPNLEELIALILKKEDYEIQEGCLYNKALQLYLYPDKVYIKNKSYYCNDYEMTVLSILHRSMYNDILGIYKSTKGSV